MLRIVSVCALVLRCHVIVADVSAIRCRTPLGPKNGRVIYSSFEYGAELEYECDEGFVLQNHQPRICNEEGIWSNDEPECIETCKEEPPPINNGKAREFAPVNGSVVEYECENGYELESHSSVQCAFGAWVGQPPVCVLSRCYLKNLQNSAYVDVAATESVTLSGNRLVVKCNEGYPKSEGPVCLNGKWSENYISPCEEDGCVIPVIHDGYMNRIKFGDFYWNWRTCRYERKTTYVKIPPGTIIANGSAVMLFCNPTCFFQGTFNRKQGITCLKGDWFPDPVCIRKEVKDLLWWKKRQSSRPWKENEETIESTNVCQVNKDEKSRLIVDPEKDYYSFGDSILLSCPPGQKLTSDVERIMCLGSTWSNTLPDCTEMTEPNLESLTTKKFE